MSQERYMKLGMLEDLRRKLRAVEDRAEGIIESLRTATFVAPLSSIFDLDTEKVTNYATELRQVSIEGQRIRSEIQKLEDELGV
ncbi:MAG: hypothetical protein IT445_00035 [Phycisphaeraceae bacterium]|nr:hypothetical protein [Phycisphaeraceae bacterium]